MHGEKTGNSMPDPNRPGGITVSASRCESRRALAGEDGLLNIEREVELSGRFTTRCADPAQLPVRAVCPKFTARAQRIDCVRTGISGHRGGLCFLWRALCFALGAVGPAPQADIAFTGRSISMARLLPVGGINEKSRGLFPHCENGPDWTAVRAC